MQTLTRCLAGALLLIACAPPVQAQTGGVADRPRRGASVPNFALPDTEGRLVSLNGFPGRAIVLSFWSCHTDTCFTSVRVFEELLREHSSRGLVAVTVCSEVPPALEKDGYAGLLRQCGTGQTVLIDKNRELTKRFGIVEFPTTYLIDRNLVVWEMLSGVRPLMADDFRLLVKSLVAEGE